MGVKGFLQVIDSNLLTICGPVSGVQGRLVIDGANLLHEFYTKHYLDWANGGCYTRLREITLEFFNNLTSARVRPIVVMDGAGVQRHIEDTIYRRNRSIGDIPEYIEKAHIRVPQGSGDTRHFLPVLAHATFMKAVKEVSDVQLICADGKANSTVVKLANHYGCPVLVNDTNYCVFNVRGGVIFYKYLTLGPGLCNASVVSRERLFRGHFRLNDLSLVFAMVAMLGDGSDKSVRGLYYNKSALKNTIDRKPGVEGGRNWPLNVSQFLRNFRNLDQFKREISTFRVDAKTKSQLSENCVSAERHYTTVSTFSCEEVCDTTTISCSYPCDVPSPLLRQFRCGNLPNFLMEAIALGKNCLSQQVGDIQQPSVVKLGSPIRAAAYGFASGLMNPRSSENVIEYHSNNADAQQQLKYTSHSVVPVCVRPELMVTNIAQLSEEDRVSLAKQTILAIFHCSWENVRPFDNDTERSWMLIVALTRFWAKYQQSNRLMQKADCVIKSMVYSFVTCFNRVHSDSQARPSSAFSDTFKDPNWIKAYHAALEWQCLYADTTGLNAILMRPFEMPSPACLYDGEVVMHYAVRGGVDEKIQQLPRSERELYDKLLAAVMAD